MTRTFASIFPFGLFMVWLVLLQFALPWLSWDHPSAGWWRRMPELWIYPAQTLSCLAALWWVRKRIAWDWKWRAQLVGVGAGVIGILFWFLPAIMYDWLTLAGYEAREWWSWFGLDGRYTGFNPGKVFADGSLAWWVSIGMRFVRAVVVVAFVEEIFWRNFLMRFAVNSDDPWKVPFGTATFRSWWLPTLAFVLVHAPVDWVAALVYGSVAWVVAVKTKNLTATITMHATANLLMGLAALAWNKPGYW